MRNGKTAFRLSQTKIISLFLCMNNFKKRIPLEDGDYYLTPEGYRCFTEQYHLKRGYCCQSGCRHCPYNSREGGNLKINTKNGK